MIEIRFAFFPTNQCKFQTMMIAVASGARLGALAADIHGGDIGMIPAFRLQTLGNGNVTLQTFRVARLPANFMARQTLR